MERVKQVIVIRKDLHMRRGKEIAQGSHASMAWLTSRLREGKLEGSMTQPQREWVEGAFTKVVLQVESEPELFAVYEAAQEAALEVHMIKDRGLTEFGGVPTNTAVGIGPDYADKIDVVTRDLKLY